MDKQDKLSNAVDSSKAVNQEGGGAPVRVASAGARRLLPENTAGPSDNVVERPTSGDAEVIPKPLRNTAVGQSYAHLHKIEQSQQVLDKNAANQGALLPLFSVTPNDLGECVNFDERNSPALYELLQSKRFGGVRGVAELLNVDLDSGLQYVDEAQLAKNVGQGAAVDIRSAGLRQRFGFGAGGKSKKVVMTAADRVEDGPDRYQAFGRNMVPPPPSDTILQIVWGTIKEDTIIKILLIGAFVVLVIGTLMHPQDGWIDGLAIFIAVAIVLTVTAINDYSKDKKFKKLLTLQSDKKVKVLRSGREDMISSWDVLVGDLVELSPGDEVPADGLFVRGVNLSIDESPLTGETIPCRKSDAKPFMFSGCQVGEGSGVMLATAVGPRSSAGQIQALLNEQQQEQTPLQKKLSDVGIQIGKLGIVAGIVTFLGLLLRWAISFGFGHVWVDTSAELLSLAKFFVVGVTIVVVAVPEGLPLAVTISLAFSMFKMIRDNCFVRHLSASETMGQATCICTDKTGTLTENRMKVVKIYANGVTFNGEGSAAQDAKPFAVDTFGECFRDLLGESISTNSTCFIKYKPNDPLPVFVGSATEGALLIMNEKLGSNYEDIRKRVSRVENGELPFSSERKCMATLVTPTVTLNGTKAKYRSYVKGASEIVFSNCKSVLDHTTTKVTALTTERTEEVNTLIKTWAKEGLRTIVLAYRDFDTVPPVHPETNYLTDLDKNLTFVALFGIKDPIRPEVPKAVKDCQKAGLVVRMVTGDNILTACTIARECGIMNDTGIAIEGPQFRAMSEEEKMTILPRLQVLARSSPTDKYVLVTLLKKMGEVVAVTGDGTNDAPALKAADVGFAMGISGTQVAMNACKILLLDDNFASIVQAIRWGRNVLEVIQKFLQFQLAVNFAAITITFIGSVAQGDSPLSAVQLLWINLIMDSFGALALASEEPPSDILERPPQSHDKPTVTRAMKQYVVMMTIYQVVISLCLLFFGYRVLGVPSTDVKKIHTLVFTTFVTFQVINEVLARQLHHEYNFVKGIFNNPLFLGMLGLICLIQVLVVQFAGGFVQVVPLNGVEWLTCIILAFLQIPYMLLARVMVRTYEDYIARNRVLPFHRSTSDTEIARLSMKEIVVVKKEKEVDEKALTAPASP